MSPVDLVRVKQTLKRVRKRMRSGLIHAFFSFSVDDLRKALMRLGIGPGDVALVHSSWDAFEGFDGKPTDVILVLEELVGPSGAVLMPTIPFSGTAMEYARSGAVFDLRKTPSRMGLLSELFRRSAGVQRSAHPTHSVAGWGADVGEILKDHHLARTPCGESSPYAALAKYDGKILLLGTGIGVLTFYHYIEEQIEDRLPRSPFTTELFSFRSRLPDGSTVATRTRLFDPVTSRSRNLSKLVEPLQRGGAWRKTRVGQLDLIALNARDIVEVTRALADRGIHCYE